MIQYIAALFTPKSKMIYSSTVERVENTAAGACAQTASSTTPEIPTKKTQLS
jgi:hypothetical protein